MSSAWGLQEMVAAACGPVVQVWSTVDPGRSLKINEGTDVFALAFSNNNKVLAVAGDKGQAQLYSRQGGAPAAVGAVPCGGLTLPSSITAIRFSPSDGHLVGGCQDGSVYVWSLKSQPQEDSPAFTLNGRVTSVAIHPRATCMATASSSGQVVLHAFPSGAKQRTLLHSGPAINGLAFGPASSSGGSLLVAASAMGSLRMWDFEAQTQPDTFTVHTSAITGVSVLPDDPHCIVSCGTDGMLVATDRRTGTIPWAIKPCRGELFSLAVKHDGSQAAVGTGGGCVLLYDLRHPSCSTPLAEHQFSAEAPVQALTWQHMPHSRSHRSERHSLGSAASVPGSATTAGGPPSSSQPAGGRSYSSREDRAPASAAPPSAAAPAPAAGASRATHAAAGAAPPLSSAAAPSQRLPAGRTPVSGGGGGAGLEVTPPLAITTATPASSSSEADCGGLRVFSPVRLYTSPLDSDAPSGAFGGGGLGTAAEAAAAAAANRPRAQQQVATPSASLLSADVVRGPAMFTPGLGLAGYGDTPGSSAALPRGGAAGSGADETPMSRFNAGSSSVVAPVAAAAGTDRRGAGARQPVTAAAGGGRSGAAASGPGSLASSYRAGAAPQESRGDAEGFKAAGMVAAKAAAAEARQAAVAASGFLRGAAVAQADAAAPAGGGGSSGGSRPSSGVSLPAAAPAAGNSRPSSASAGAAVGAPASSSRPSTATGDAAAAASAAGRPGGDAFGMAALAAGGGGLALREDVFKAYVDTRMEELRQDVQSMHVDMMRSFQQTQSDLAAVLDSLAARQDQLAEAITELTITVQASRAVKAAPVSAGVSMIPWI